MLMKCLFYSYIDIIPYINLEKRFVFHSFQSSIVRIKNVEFKNIV